MKVAVLMFSIFNLVIIQVSCISKELIDEIKKISLTLHDPIGDKPRGQGAIVMSESMKEFYEITKLENLQHVLTAHGIIPDIKQYFAGIVFASDVAFKAFILHFDNGQGALDIYYGIAHKQTYGEAMKNSDSFIKDPTNPKWSKPVVSWSMAIINSKVCVEHMQNLWYSCPYKTSFTQQEKPLYVDRMKFKSTQYFLDAAGRGVFIINNPIIDPSLN